MSTATQPRGRVATLPVTQLRVATAGSVDDGKSTLIGCLLHDSRTVHEDQWDAMTKASRRYGDGGINLALLTDGLRAERQQGITIDVAYRYFSTPHRSFIIADTPGHAEYTRNMVTGASVSDVAVVLVDARHGVVEQTTRHIAISALLGVAHIVVAVNKMDLVNWSQTVFDEIVLDVATLVEHLRPGLPLNAVPVSALHGDNVVKPGDHGDWYDGPTLLALLETLDADTESDTGARLGVQWVVRAHGGSKHRGLAGRLTGGTLAVGDEIDIVTTGHRSTITELRVSGRPVDDARPGDAVSVVLHRDLDVGCGDLLVATRAPTRPVVTRTATIDVCWMTDTALRRDSRWLAVHRHGTTPIRIADVRTHLDLIALRHEPAQQLDLNDLGRADITFDQPVALDLYSDHRHGGALILVDPTTNETIAAATIAKIEAK